MCINFEQLRPLSANTLDKPKKKRHNHMLGLMRAYTFGVALLVCSVPLVAPAEEPAGPQLVAYQSRVSDIAFRAIVPEFRKRPEHLRGALKVIFKVDRRGYPSGIIVASSTSDHWVQDTAKRVIRSTKFPPFQPKLLAEIKQDYVYVTAEWRFHFEPNKT
jgi:hypothetical protein